MPIYHIRPDRKPAGWHILTLADIPFYVEPSFLIVLLIFMAPSPGLQHSQQANALSEAGLTGFIVFFSLLAHEAGHALTARLLGYRDISVSLAGLGGVTRHPATTRGHSLVITLAGPLVTILLAATSWGLFRLNPSWMSHDVSKFIAFKVLFLNVIWAIFNLLPIYPMDGGKAVLAVLAFMMRYTRAMLTTSIVSLAACAGLALLLFTGYLGSSLILALFIGMFALDNIRIVKDLWPRR